MTDFKSSENSSDLGHFKKTLSSQGGLLRDSGRVLIDPGYSLGGAGGITKPRPPCNLDGEMCCKTRQTRNFAALDLKELSGCSNCTSGTLSVELGLGEEKKYVSCCSFSSLTVWSVGNSIMLKTTTSLFITGLVGLQNRTWSL